MDIDIPRSTQIALAKPAAPGHRHEQMVTLACSLAAQKLAAPAITAQLRSMYDEGMSDEEIGRVVDWAVAQDYEPARISPRRRRATWRRRKPRAGFQICPAQLVERSLGDFRSSLEELTRASSLEVPSDYAAQSILALQSLYSPSDAINIVTDYALEPGGKAKPRGYGRTLKRDEWITHIRQSGAPQTKAGAWLRMNPLDGRGIGDRNVTSFRYCLLESDILPEDLQISFLAKLRLPIVMIVGTGGRSFHAWVRVNATCDTEYCETVRFVLKKLRPFGWDDANKNPGRLSRLPGVRREIGAQKDGLQRLIYLNPEPTGNSIL